MLEHDPNTGVAQSKESLNTLMVRYEEYTKRIERLNCINDLELEDIDARLQCLIDSYFEFLYTVLGSIYDLTEDMVLYAKDLKLSRFTGAIQNHPSRQALYKARTNLSSISSVLTAVDQSMFELSEYLSDRGKFSLPSHVKGNTDFEKYARVVGLLSKTHHIVAIQVSSQIGPIIRALDDLVDDPNLSQPYYDLGENLRSFIYITDEFIRLFYGLRKCIEKSFSDTFFMVELNPEEHYKNQIKDRREELRKMVNSLFD